MCAFIVHIYIYVFVFFAYKCMQTRLDILTLATPTEVVRRKGCLFLLFPAADGASLVVFCSITKGVIFFYFCTLVLLLSGTFIHHVWLDSLIAGDQRGGREMVARHKGSVPLALPPTMRY